LIAPGFLVSILALAALDSLNPATIVAVTLILLSAPKRAGLIALSAIIGAFLTVFGVGAALFISAGAAAGAIDGLTIVLRSVAFGAASIALIVVGVRRFRDRNRKSISLPKWFTPIAALPFGVLLTAADLPNAFPYFIAIERLLSNEVSSGTGLLVILGYSIVYCIPCLILLVVGTLRRNATRDWLERIVAKLGTGVVKRSVPIALITIAGGIAVASIPFFAL
jgi:uncharacterized membrane protein YhaH (DUF805 family)